jgi:hypothetical protein
VAIGNRGATPAGTAWRSLQPNGIPADCACVCHVLPGVGVTTRAQIAQEEAWFLATIVFAVQALRAVTNRFGAWGNGGAHTCALLVNTCLRYKPSRRMHTAQSEFI